MTIDYSDFTRASNLIHSAQGGALLILGAAEAYAARGGARRAAAVAAAAVLVLAGAATFLAVLALPGGWNLEQLSAALSLRRGFYLFIAFACVFAGAGLGRLTQESLGRSGGGWHAVFLANLAFAGVLYFMLAWRVNEEAWGEVLARHASIGAALLAAVAARAADLRFPRPALRAAWTALLLVTGLQLLVYREAQSAFAPRLVTIQAAPGLPEAAPAAPTKNAPDKERPAR